MARMTGVSNPPSAMDSMVPSEGGGTMDLHGVVLTQVCSIYFRNRQKNGGTNGVDTGLQQPALERQQGLGGHLRQEAVVPQSSCPPPLLPSTSQVRSLFRKSKFSNARNKADVFYLSCFPESLFSCL